MPCREPREPHTHESQLAPGSRPTPWHSYNTQGRGSLCDLHEGAMCAGLAVGSVLVTETLEPKSLLLSNTGASEGKWSQCRPSAASVPDLCPVPQSTGSGYRLYKAGSENVC